LVIKLQKLSGEYFIILGHPVSLVKYLDNLKGVHWDFMLLGSGGELHDTGRAA
jgi:hypothetical protein